VPNVRNEAGIVGASDWKNRYSSCPGRESAGSSGSGDSTGHHITIAEPSSAVCSEKCASSERTDSDTTAGQWTKNRNPLAITRATSGRVSKAHAERTGGGRSRARHIHAGIPVRSSGAARNVNSMCCTMCML
jgi:hypothetical protein